MLYPRSFMLSIFQSTLSMRRATQAMATRATHAKFQSTLSMRRATLLIIDT